MYLRPKGYSVVTDGWGIETREDCSKCGHCQRVLFFGAGSDPQEHVCRTCMQQVCAICANGPCDHWEKKLDRAEETDRWLWRKFGEKVERASTDDELLRIHGQMERERMFRDMGLI